MKVHLTAAARGSLRRAGALAVLLGLVSIGWWTLLGARRQLFATYADWAVGSTSRDDSLAMIPAVVRPRLSKIRKPGRGDLLGSIEVPRLRLSTAVLEGSDEHTLELGVGHIESTALPGEIGNVGLAGHRDTVFRPLRNIRLDDEILVSSAFGVKRYTVTETLIVEPTQVEVLNPTDNETLTLVTCYPFDYVGPAPKRFIVVAKAPSPHDREAN